MESLPIPEVLRLSADGKPLLSALFPLTPGVFTTCTEMSGNGVRTGMEHIRLNRLLIPPALRMAKFVF